VAIKPHQKSAGTERMSITKVQKLVAGWEPIPNAFANDLRLSSDAVAVGLWLAIKPAGWQVRPVAIQAEFSRRPGKLRGRDWWARVSGELKDAGYLKLKRSKDAKGQFATNWDFCVFGLSESGADMDTADDGSATHGSHDSGSRPQSNQHQSDSALNTKTQHTKEAGTPDNQGVCVEVDAMLTAAQLSAGVRKLIGKELAVLTSDLQKAVAREFIAHLASIRTPVPWVRRVCSDTLSAGEFVPAKQHQSAQKISNAAPEKRTCEIDGCLKYAATRSTRGWRCVDHISK
jgi:hypothetical protein